MRIRLNSSPVPDRHIAEPRRALKLSPPPAVAFAAGKSWFVLSGYRGETIYYQKVLFSCGDRIINILQHHISNRRQNFL